MVTKSGAQRRARGHCELGALGAAGKVYGECGPPAGDLKEIGRYDLIDIGIAFKNGCELRFDHDREIEVRPGLPQERNCGRRQDTIAQ